MEQPHLKSLRVFDKPVNIWKFGLISPVLWVLNFARYQLEKICIRIVYVRMGAYEKENFNSFMRSFGLTIPIHRKKFALRDKGIVPKTREERYGDRSAAGDPRVLFTYTGEKPRRYAVKRKAVDLFQEFEEVEELALTEEAGEIQ